MLVRSEDNTSTDWMWWSSPGVSRMARSPAKKMPASPLASRGSDRKKAVSAAAAKNPAQSPVADAGVATKTTKPVPPPMPKGRLFAVTRSRGLAWNPEQPPAGQVGWSDHAQFMADLESSG